MSRLSHQHTIISHDTVHGRIKMTYDRLPPGTQRIEDRTGQKILLAPQPNADPNQPLVCSIQSESMLRMFESESTPSCPVLSSGIHSVTHVFISSLDSVKATY
jgi:hypothetical protein